MELPSFPDDWLQDVFVRLDCVKQFSLRRTCSRWNRLLRTNFVLRNLIIHEPDCEKLPNDSALQSLAHILPEAPLSTENVLITTSRSSTAESKPCSEFFLNLIALLGNWRENGRPRRLVLQNLHINDPVILALVWGKVFRRIDFQNVMFCGVGMWLLFVTRRKIFERLAVRALLYTTSLHSLLVPIPDYTMECAVGLKIKSEAACTESYLDAACRLLVEKVPLLSESQTKEMRERIGTFDEDILRYAVTELITEFQPDIELIKRKIFDLENLDVGKFLPIMACFLYVWDGCNLND